MNRNFQALALAAFCVSASCSAAQITVDASNPIAPISSRQVGSNLGNFFPVSANEVTNMQAIGAQLLRWPGGSNADGYHWADGSYCGGLWADPSASYANFVNTVAVPGNFELALTVNYGSNRACTAGGDPNEAANWVAYNKSHGVNAHYYTVGNEVFGGWEYDLHPLKNDAATYAAAINGADGYYALMKAKDPAAKVGIVVEGAGWNYWDAWDKTVLPAVDNLDFVELHWYAQQPGAESDSYLLNQAPQDFASAIKTVRTELVLAGKPITTPIMLGEFNSVSYNQGKQSMSIVNALFLGQLWGEVIRNKVAVATMWFGYGGGCNTGGNNAASLYGWQDFGAYDAVASSWSGCNTFPTVPDGAIMPAGRAAYLVSRFASDGEHLLNSSVDASLPNVRAYAATKGAGYSLLLFNLDSANAQTVGVGIANSGRTSFTASTITYGKQQYDSSRNNVWTGPVTQSIGSVGASLNVTLPAWSMVVVTLQ